MYRDWKISFEGGIYTASRDGATSMTAESRVAIERKVDQRIENRGLRAIKVWWSDGTDQVSSMAADLTDAQMLNYYAVGTQFNIGRGPDDYIVKVAKAEILI